LTITTSAEAYSYAPAISIPAISTEAPSTQALSHIVRFLLRSVFIETWYRTHESLHDTIAAFNDKDIPHEVHFIINKFMHAQQHLVLCAVTRMPGYSCIT
jgi:hypothetical protein